MPFISIHDDYIKPCYAIWRHQALLHNTATSSHATQYGDIKPCYTIRWRQALLCNMATSSPTVQQGDIKPCNAIIRWQTRLQQNYFQTAQVGSSCSLGFQRHYCCLLCRPALETTHSYNSELLNEPISHLIHSKLIDDMEVCTYKCAFHARDDRKSLCPRFHVLRYISAVPGPVLRTTISRFSK
jgi:hypothetical protein